ncbi:MAG: nucleotidyltransferase domain-containing protein [Candidatus Electrothrix sp. AW2]|jgi:predicted nucleotidyltransferase|nr:nucleotidyltransferase domain-containing protein [Candidatus Electrothrix sp. AX1]MCI5134689.1 nucleotidyltransferase domain-containing protein [Candidatus Electrothrix gigas]MCI5178958.1 nucleotidyltransferase domain-containing protein [Candidatus Electrothrix gigas]MCI5184065.1 nucleotidyltransferase domain-containing protein [Candidatus Electrothrix gigas]MCI5226516.1 nucleotidyltransferase domain-containing protein [Candidatus Electrothrix gigas]
MKSEKQMLQNYLTELKNILTELNPYKAVLFGSCAYGKVGDDSDIDLIVVLDKDDVPRNFNERIENYSLVKKYFKFLKHKVPMDLIVYTRSEWERFVQADNSFTREVLEKGKVLI